MCVTSTLSNRRIIYVVVFLFSFLETVFSAISAANEGWSEFRVLLSKIALGYAIVTCLWITILLFYINRRLQSHFFTKKAVHLACFIVFALTWPVPGIMLLVTICQECDSAPGANPAAAAWCRMSATSGSAGVFIAISSLITAILVGHVKVGSDGNIAGLSVNHDA